MTTNSSRPGLLSRHLTLLSQTHTLTTALLSPRSASQAPSLVALLTREAQTSNLYADPSSTETSLALLAPLPQTAAPSNPLEASSAAAARQKRLAPRTSTGRHHAPHPVQPVDVEKSNTLVPALLLAKAAPAVDDQVEARLAAFISEADAAEGANVSTMSAIRWRSRISRARHKTVKHDDFAGQMTRLWIHCREAPDEYGEKYDWNMRLSLEESDDEADEGEGEENGGEDIDDEAESEKRKRKREDEDQNGKREAPLSVDQVLSFLKTGTRA